MSKSQDFSITRAPYPLISRALYIAVSTDAIYVLTLFLILGIRNTLGVDATLAGLALLLFFIKTALMVYGLFMVLSGWLKTSYFVMGGQLVIYSRSVSKQSEVYNLSEIRSIKLRSNRPGKKFNYGNIEIKFAQGGTSDTIILTDVSHPNQVVTQLKKPA